MDPICFTKVKLPYGWMSNMSPHPVEYDGVWRTTEHLFQAMRFGLETTVAEFIRAEKSPMGAKMKAKTYLGTGLVKVQPRTPEDLDNMRLCIRLKVRQHLELAGLLLCTDDRLIIEDVRKRPSESGLFWGGAPVFKYPDDKEYVGHLGENWLGRLWMEYRAKLRAVEIP
jgi:predicted NAD-dependent protein-ADP-ribosyltransferase YbiA (DUF1768 family)